MLSDDEAKAANVEVKLQELAEKQLSRRWELKKFVVGLVSAMVQMAISSVITSMLTAYWQQRQLFKQKWNGP